MRRGSWRVAGGQAVKDLEEQAKDLELLFFFFFDIYFILFYFFLLCCILFFLFIFYCSGFCHTLK